jgi:hypothetical protein
MGRGNISIHDRKRQCYWYKICKQTISRSQGTMFEGLRKPGEQIMIVVTFLSYGCFPAMVSCSIKLMGDTAYSILELALHVRAQ